MTTGVQTWLRLGLAPATNEAALEGKARSLERLTDLALSGRSLPLELAALRVELEAVADREATTHRGMSAVLRAANCLDRLDTTPAGAKALTAREEVEEDDPFTLLDRITSNGTT